MTPGRHYIPASLDNLTKVVEYVISPENDIEIKRVVRAANEWCRSAIGVETVTRSAMEQIGKYYSDLHEAFVDNDASLKENDFAFKHVDDLVPCFEESLKNKLDR